MPGHDRHGPREIAIFSRFAEVCDLPVQLDSIEKREPPEPDIGCMIAGEGPVAFEMVELIHSDLAELSSRSMMYQQLLEEAYQRLPVAQRAALEKRYGNALVSIAFRLNVPASGRRGSIPVILSWLHGLEPAFTGGYLPGPDILPSMFQERSLTTSCPSSPVASSAD